MNRRGREMEGVGYDTRIGSELPATNIFHNL